MGVEKLNSKAKKKEIFKRFGRLHPVYCLYNPVNGITSLSWFVFFKQQFFRSGNILREGCWFLAQPWGSVEFAEIKSSLPNCRSQLLIMITNVTKPFTNPIVSVSNSIQDHFVGLRRCTSHHVETVESYGSPIGKLRAFHSVKVSLVKESFNISKMLNSVSRPWTSGSLTSFRNTLNKSAKNFSVEQTYSKLYYKK